MTEKLTSLINAANSKDRQRFINAAKDVAKDAANSKDGQRLMSFVNSNPYGRVLSRAVSSDMGQKVLSRVISSDMGQKVLSRAINSDMGQNAIKSMTSNIPTVNTTPTDISTVNTTPTANTADNTTPTANTAISTNKEPSGLIKSTMNSVQDFSRMTNVEKVNFTFKNIYYLLLFLIVILIISLVFSIFMLPLIILYKKYQEQHYINMNIDVPINLLLKYEISNYIWCTYDTFFENSNNFQTYKYYIPIVIIYLISFIISIILMIAFINFIIVIYMLFTEDIKPEQAYDKDIAIIGKYLASFTLILISLWVIFYLVFQFTFMTSINEITKNNHYTDLIISDIVFDKNIFKDKNILDKFLTDILINKKNIKDTMKDFYNKYQFSDDSKSKFITLYPIFNYLNNNNLDYSEKNPDFIYKIKAYFMNPHENKDNLIGFISQKNNITPNSYINTELLKDIFGDEKNNSYSNIKKLATDKYVTIVKNLNKSNQSMDNSNVTLYSIILLISIIIIISLLIFLAKYSF